MRALFSKALLRAAVTIAVSNLFLNAQKSQARVPVGTELSVRESQSGDSETAFAFDLSALFSLYQRDAGAPPFVMGAFAELDLSALMLKPFDLDLEAIAEIFESEDPKLFSDDQEIADTVSDEDKNIVAELEKLGVKDPSALLEDLKELGAKTELEDGQSLSQYLSTNEGRESIGTLLSSHLMGDNDGLSPADSELSRAVQARLMEHISQGGGLFDQIEAGYNTTQRDVASDPPSPAEQDEGSSIDNYLSPSEKKLIADAATEIRSESTTQTKYVNESAFKAAAIAANIEAGVAKLDSQNAKPLEIVSPPQASQSRSIATAGSVSEEPAEEEEKAVTSDPAPIEDGHKTNDRITASDNIELDDSPFSESSFREPQESTPRLDNKADQPIESSKVAPSPELAEMPAAGLETPKPLDRVPTTETPTPQTDAVSGPTSSTDTPSLTDWGSIKDTFEGGSESGTSAPTTPGHHNGNVQHLASVGTPGAIPGNPGVTEIEVDGRKGGVFDKDIIREALTEENRERTKNSLARYYTEQNPNGDSTAASEKAEQTISRIERAQEKGHEFAAQNETQETMNALDQLRIQELGKAALEKQGQLSGEKTPAALKARKAEKQDAFGSKRIDFAALRKNGEIEEATVTRGKAKAEIVRGERREWMHIALCHLGSKESTWCNKEIMAKANNPDTLAEALTKLRDTLGNDDCITSVESLRVGIRGISGDPSHSSSQRCTMLNEGLKHGWKVHGKVASSTDLDVCAIRIAASLGAFQDVEDAALEKYREINELQQRSGSLSPKEKETLARKQRSFEVDFDVNAEYHQKFSERLNQNIQQAALLKHLQEKGSNHLVPEEALQMAAGGDLKASRDMQRRCFFFAHLLDARTGVDDRGMASEYLASLKSALKATAEDKNRNRAAISDDEIAASNHGLVGLEYIQTLMKESGLLSDNIEDRRLSDDTKLYDSGLDLAANVIKPYAHDDTNGILGEMEDVERYSVQVWHQQFQRLFCAKDIGNSSLRGFKEYLQNSSEKVEDLKSSEVIAINTWPGCDTTTNAGGTSHARLQSDLSGN